MMYIGIFHSLDGGKTYFIPVEEIALIRSLNNSSVVVFKSDKMPDLEIKEGREEVYKELTTLVSRHP